MLDAVELDGPEARGEEPMGGSRSVTPNVSRVADADKVPST
jgi:hypothetical protein